MTLAALLADDPPIDPTTGHGPEWGKAAPVALLIIVLMGIAVYLLIRSMNKQLKKVPKSFVAEPDAPVPPAAAAAADATVDDAAPDEAEPAAEESKTGHPIG